MQEVFGVERLAPNLGVEVCPTSPEPAALKDVVVGERDLGHVVWELIGVPARLRIATVDVDRAEDPERLGERQLMLERVAGKRRVVGLDVNLDLILQPAGFRRSCDDFRGIYASNLPHDV